MINKNQKLITLLIFFTFIVFGFQKLSALNTGSIEKEAQEILTNDSIIKLVEAGLSEKTIISLIKQSLTKFDLAPQTIIKLKQAGVSDKIIETMLGTAENTSIQEEKPKEKEILQTLPAKVNTTKLSEQQVVETMEAIETANQKKDLNELAKYLADNFVWKGLQVGGQGLEMTTFNKDQYLSSMKSQFESPIKVKVTKKLIDRKIELLPDGITAKVIQLDYIKTESNGYKQNLEATNTLLLVLNDGRVMISECKNKIVLK
jgi:hypothetical protein